MEKTVLCNSPRLSYVINNPHISPSSLEIVTVLPTYYVMYPMYPIRTPRNHPSPDARVSNPLGRRYKHTVQTVVFFIPLQYHDIYIYIYIIYIYFLSVPQIRFTLPFLRNTTYSTPSDIIFSPHVTHHPFFRRSMIRFLLKHNPSCRFI